MPCPFTAGRAGERVDRNTVPGDGAFHNCSQQLRVLPGVNLPDLVWRLLRRHIREPDSVVLECACNVGLNDAQFSHSFLESERHRISARLLCRRSGIGIDDVGILHFELIVGVCGNEGRCTTWSRN